MVFKGKLFLRVIQTLALSALISANPAWASGWPEPEMTDPRALALGGAIRSIPDTMASPRSNPAAIGPFRGFFVGASHLTMSKGPLDATQVTLVDNVSSHLGGALQYYRLNGDMDREDVGLTICAGQKGMFLGFTGRFVHGRDDEEDSWDNAFVGDIGILLERDGGLRIAVVGHDLFASTIDYLQSRVALGVSKEDYNDFTLSFDLVRNLDENFDKGQDYHLGLEYRPGNSSLGFAVGQMWEGSTSRDRASVGVFLSDKNYRLGYAVQKTRQEDNEYLHSVSIMGSM